MLYMARSDVGYTVRAAALHVWKTIVSNTPRTLAEILPTLMRTIIASLAAPGARSLPLHPPSRMASQRYMLQSPCPGAARLGCSIKQVAVYMGQRQQW